MLNTPTALSADCAAPANVLPPDVSTPDFVVVYDKGGPRWRVPVWADTPEDAVAVVKYELCPDHAVVLT